MSLSSRPPGRFQNATLSLELGDPDAQEFDMLQITGDATLDGTLSIAWLDSFFAREGDGFPVLTFASLTGKFATLKLPDLGDELMLVPNYAEADFSLAVSRRP